MDYLHFSVDGEFICNLARTWFWDENRPYEKCEELLLCCLDSDEITLEEKKEIVIEILEGKMKLVGINVCHLVEDGENVRDLSEKIKEYEKNDLIQKITTDMDMNPLIYVDKFAAGKDLSEYEDYLQTVKAEESKNSVIQWLYSNYNGWKGSYSLDEKQLHRECGLRRGTYLMNAYLVYDLFRRPLSMVDEEEKYEKLFHYFDQSASSDEIFFRQNLYLAYLRKNELKNHKDEKRGFDREICYIPEPDEFISPHGLIDPDGNYYSCGFGGHSAKAFSIIKKDPEKFNIDLKDEKSFLATGDESETLYENGWLIVHNTSMMGDPYFKVNPNIEITEPQVSKSFDYMVHFDRMDMNCMNDLIENATRREKHDL